MIILPSGYILLIYLRIQFRIWAMLDTVVCFAGFCLLFNFFFGGSIH